MNDDSMRVVSVAMDASRVGNKDTLYSCLWDCAAGRGCWGDPMVAREREPPSSKCAVKGLLFWIIRISSA